MIIYKATNILDNKSYIGLTTRSLQERKLEHLRHINVENTYFHRAINKYGKENFTWEILDDSAQSLNELQKLEQFYIKELNTLAPNGYNITTGGENANFETRRDYSYGNNPSAREVINLTTMKIFDSIKRASEEYHVSTESIRKAINHKTPCCNCIWDYYNNNKDFQQQFPSKIANSHKRVKNIKTGKIFNNMSVAAETYHIARKTIRDSCNKVNQGDWEWAY